MIYDTTSVPEYKHLLTFADHVWPFVLYCKNLWKIIYFAMTSFIIIYFQVYHNYFCIFTIFWIRRMVKRASRKSKNAYILERREPSLSAEHVCRAFFACAHDKVHMTVICTTNRFLTCTFYRAHDKLFAVRFQFRMAKKSKRRKVSSQWCKRQDVSSKWHSDVSFAVR
jgi:hypothetical protein